MLQTQVTAKESCSVRFNLTLGEEDGKIVAVKLNHKLNACSLKEQERLKKEFSDEDIFVCKRNNPNACYVKVRMFIYMSRADSCQLEHSVTFI
jgi:hypothetical protein